MTGRDRLVLMGTKGGPAIRPGATAMPTSSLLVIDGRVMVVDCGLGVTRGLVDAGVALPDLERIFVTHLHSDHVLELGPLLHTAWTAGLAHPVTVHGPPGVERVWEGLLHALDFDISLRIGDEGRPDLRELVRFVPLAPGAAAVPDLSVAALRVPHPPVDDCFALRFDAKGWRVTFGADTAYHPPLAAFARGSEILVHEAMLEGGIDALCRATPAADRLRAHLEASHTALGDVVRIAREAGAGLTLLNHLVPLGIPGFGHEAWETALAALDAPPMVVGRDGTTVFREVTRASAPQRPVDANAEERR